MLKIASQNKKIECISYWLLIAAIAFNISSTSFAQNKTVDTIGKAPEASSLVAEYPDKPISEVRRHQSLPSPINVFSNLLTLIFIMFAMAWLYKKYGKDFLSKTLKVKNLSKDSINIVSTLPIGQNKYLHIIEVENERMLIGSTNTNISLIKNLKTNTEEKAVSDE